MNSGSDSDLDLKPLDNIQCMNVAALKALPETSKEKYTAAYRLFMDWLHKHNTNSLSEDVLLTYFGEIATKFKATTLWTQYSMLKATLASNNGIDMGNYAKLRAFLRRKSAGFRPKTTKTFTSVEINKFIAEAPDREYLLEKVVLIMGIAGACRRQELYKMKVANFKDLGAAVLVQIPSAKSKTTRKFTITGHFYTIFKKYADLRPPNVNEPWFFLNYHKGKCSVQKVGINKLGNMGKQIALFLELPNAEMYTGHCFRRSSVKGTLGSAYEESCCNCSEKTKPDLVQEDWTAPVNQDELIIKSEPDDSADPFAELASPQPSPGPSVTLPASTQARLKKYRLRKLMKRKAKVNFKKQLLAEIKRTNDIAERELQQNRDMHDSQIRCLEALERAANQFMVFVNKDNN